MSPALQSSTSAIFKITDRLTSSFFLSLVNVADYNPAFLRNSALLISLCTEDPEFLKIDLHLNTPYNSPCKFRECRKTLLLSFLFYYRSAMSLFQDITHSFANSFNRFIDNY